MGRMEMEGIEMIDCLFIILMLTIFILTMMNDYVVLVYILYY